MQFLMTSKYLQSVMSVTTIIYNLIVTSVVIPTTNCNHTEILLNLTAKVRIYFVVCWPKGGWGYLVNTVVKSFECLTNVGISAICYSKYCTITGNAIEDTYIIGRMICSVSFIWFCFLNFLSAQLEKLSFLFIRWSILVSIKDELFSR